ncbi:lengsin-like [Diadema antillarum]|uniref:lengsin-like n=1 Tax=Diadema antillarum TaxID=105358 RepID=UPI003A883AD1
MGISLLGAHEFEFVVEEAASNDPIFFGSNCGHLLNLSRAESLVQQFLQYLPQMGLNVETVESEAGPGQLEVTYQPTNGLNIGDNGYTFKTSIKEICQKNGFNASFRSKHAETVTSSSHFCHSLWDARNSMPLMSDPEGLYGMSALARHWLAGLLHHAPAMTLLMCPTINCLDRLGTSPSTPTTASWGIDNRSCAFRLHLPSDPSNGGGMFLENRIGGAGGNPYLTMAATLAAGIDGIVRQLALPVPTEGVVPADFTSTLPTNMSDCLDAFLADDVICDAMGPDFVHCFTTLKRHEMNLHREAERSGDSSWLHTFFEHI